MVRPIIIFILLYIFDFYAFGQKPPLIFQNLSIRDGLSDNSIKVIIEDKKGYMWIGTEDGLNKFDGYKFTVYKNNPKDSFSISNRNIKSFYIDSKNNFWILTTNGINIYDPTQDIFYNFKNNRYKALKELYQDIVSLTEDSKGRIWITTANEELICINSLHEPVIKYKYPYNDNSKLFLCIASFTDTSLIIGTKDGLIGFNSVSNNFFDLRPEYGHEYELNKIYKDKKGVFWLCTNLGLKAILKNKKLREYVNDPVNNFSLNENSIFDITPYSDGTYIIGTNSSGIDLFDERTNRFYHYTQELSSNNVNCVFVDSKMDIWVGTYFNGLDFSNSTTNLFNHVKNNPYSDQSIKRGIVTRFMEDHNKNLWITTDGGGIFKKNNNSEKYINYDVSKGLSSNVTIGIFEDPDGEIWVTTFGEGLCKFNPVNKTFTTYKAQRDNLNSLFNNYVKDMCFYDGKLWISGYGLGLGIFDKKTNQFTHIKYGPQENDLRSDWVQKFYLDKKGTLWLGTFSGLAKYIPETKSFKTYFLKSNADSHNNTDINIIIDIFEDSQDNLWLGTMGNGLVLFNRENESYKIFTTEDGLSNNLIKSIIEDNDNNLWLATNDGVTKFDIFNKKAKSYNLKDGVPPCSFHYNSNYKDSLGRIYFGAHDGYVIINPKMTKENKHIPPVVLTEFKIQNILINPRDKGAPLKACIGETSEIILSHDQNSLSFEFAALNFNSSKNNQYAYYLEGFDNSWFYVGNQRTATYTNLNPGVYTLRVKASNNDNVWNEEGISLKIIIEPPFWKTWWFVTLILLGILLLLYLIYLWRIRVIRNENILLDEMVKQRTVQLKEANEQLETLVYKASHDIKGPLKSIIGLTTIGKKDVMEGGDPLHYFEHILKSTQKLDGLLLDLLTVTKIKQATLNSEKINFKDLTTEVLTSFQNFPGYEKMKFYIDINEVTEFKSDKKLIFSILQNLIENSIKYRDESKNENYLKVEINTSSKGAHMSFKDNGIGVPEEFKKNIFDMFFKANEDSNGTGLGMYIVKTTIEKLNGSISMESDVGKGTAFFIKI